MEFELPDSHKDFYFELGYCMAGWMRVENSAFHVFYAMCADMDESVLPPISWYHIQSFDSKIELLRTVGKLQIEREWGAGWQDLLVRLKEASLSRNAIIHGAQEEKEDGSTYIRTHDLDVGAMLKKRHLNPKYTFAIGDLRRQRELFNQLSIDLGSFVSARFPHAFKNPPG